MASYFEEHNCEPGERARENVLLELARTLFNGQQIDLGAVDFTDWDQRLPPPAARRAVLSLPTVRVTPVQADQLLPSLPPRAAHGRPGIRRIQERQGAEAAARAPAGVPAWGHVHITGGAPPSLPPAWGIGCPLWVGGSLGQWGVTLQCGYKVVSIPELGPQGVSPDMDRAPPLLSNPSIPMEQPWASPPLCCGVRSGVTLTNGPPLSSRLSRLIKGVFSLTQSVYGVSLGSEWGWRA
ncbi:E3 ubiquitin-protein ligase RNF181 isoform X1 [Dermochelys coriacea]|uniref:E3 ubiquitin-protein ligase RNF181 isoform X1 n=1 Tax=Dermochelys coriacea TaxID=27794 RepID=UPI001CA96701|nr:E3 ubiquitin-protein ligase RNF181 isoform X1 [Dermochelys coriacea]